MCPRTLVRYLLYALPRPLRRKAAFRLRFWLGRRGPLQIRCDGLRLELDFAEHSALSFYTDGLIERPVRRLLLSLLRPGMVMADVGSNMGYFALVAGRCVAPGGRAIAFEPVPSNLAFLRRNLALNPGIDNVTVEALAASDREGEATFHLGWHEGNASLLSSARGTTQETTTVRTVSLDHYLDAQRIERVDVVKMDIEGAEVMALEGMASGLRAGRYGDLLIEWHAADHGDLGERPRAVLAMLGDVGYELRCIERRQVRPLCDEDRAKARVHIHCRRVA